MISNLTEKAYLFISIYMQKQPPKIFAHRGTSSEAPENTLAAIKLAWQQSADGVEIDIRLSRNGQIVVIHDGNTERTTGKNRIIANKTLNEIQSLDAGSWKDRKWKDEKIPALEEVLKVVPAGKQIMIEIKTGPEIITVLKRIIKHCKLKSRQIILASFSLTTAYAARRSFPNHEVILISKYPGNTFPALIRKIKQMKLDGLSLQACSAIDRVLVSTLRIQKLKFYVWTINAVSNAKRYAELGVDGIITNYPAKVRKSIYHTNQTF